MQDSLGEKERGLAMGVGFSSPIDSRVGGFWSVYLIHDCADLTSGGSAARLSAIGAWVRVPTIGVLYTPAMGAS